MQHETGKPLHIKGLLRILIPPFPGSNPGARQPVRSLRRRFRLCEDRRHFRGLAGNGRVFGEENRALPTEEGVFLDESLLHAPQPCSFFVIVAARLQQSRESYAICSDMRRFGPR